MPKKIPGTHRKKTCNKKSFYHQRHYKKLTMHASELELILRSRENQKKIVCCEKETVYDEKIYYICDICCCFRNSNIYGNLYICINCSNLVTKNMHSNWS